ncbi:hypothetical protein [Micromonospora avicenniae]|uniref:hypothetical protein n=1 Tax=Micromonospora avicenniae TaxID=1198245 RepID=UPI00341D7DF2
MRGPYGRQVAIHRIAGIHAISRDTHLDHAVPLTNVSGLPMDTTGEPTEPIRHFDHAVRHIECAAAAAPGWIV